MRTVGDAGPYNTRKGISYHSLERDLQRASKEPVREQKNVEKLQIAEVAAGADKTAKATRFILAAKLFSKPYAKAFSLESICFDIQTHQTVAQYITEKEKAGERIRPSELFELLGEDSAEFNAILDLNYEDKLSGDVAERFFMDSVKTLEKANIENEIAKIRKEYETETDDEKKRETAKRLAECVRRRNGLKK